MFDNLGKKLQGVVRDIRGQSTITEKNVKDALREVRMALLEADVHFQVVKDFVARARERALGEEVLNGVNPSQQFVKVVHDELVETMGGEAATFALSREKINVVMLVGLQGSGKTTFAGKLATRLKKEDWKPLLVACDVYRPAAVEQLKTVGRQAEVPVFEMGTAPPVVEIALRAVEEAKAQGHDVVIVDTAGRLHIDEMKMGEIAGLRDALKPDFTFYVADAMTGQDAVNSAAQFHESVGADGVCLTKLDGDARGGAALSIQAVTGRPIYFVGVGEQLDALELFHPDRMAQRILGMGDVLTLVEKAQEAFDMDEAEALRRKIRKESFTLDDFLKQMKRMKKMGSMGGLMKMIPGMGDLMGEIDEDEMDREMRRTEAIISSMTLQERMQPSILNGSRRARIGKGCGLGVPAVNKLLKEFEMARKMMKEMMGGGGGGLKGLMGALGGAGGGDGADMERAAKRLAATRGGHGPGRGKSKKNQKKKKKKQKSR